MKKIINKNKNLIFLILILVIATFFRLYFNPMDIDDATIGYRVIENIASGKGFEYNSGEKVLSTSAPLHIIIISFFTYLGMDVIFATNALSLISALITIILVYFILKEINFENAGLIAAFILAISNDFVIYTMNGMETSFYTMLWMTSIYFFIKKKYSLTGLFLGLLVFTRVDGAMLAIALGLLYIFNHKKIPWKMAIIAILVFMPWIIFATSYFGSPIPNTLKAKQLQAGSDSTFFIRIFAFLYDETFLLLIPFIIIGLIKIFNKKEIWPIYFGSLLYLIAYTAIQIHGYIWYYIPLIPIIVIFAAIGITYVTKRIFSQKKIYSNLFLIIFMISIVATSILGMKHYKQKVDIKWESYKEIGLWFNQNTEPTDTIMFHDIGYVGYYSERYIWDYNLLIHKQEKDVTTKLSYPEFMKKYNPNYVLHLKKNVVDTIENSAPDYVGYELFKTFTDDFSYQTDDLRYKLNFKNYYYIFKRK
ncbi:hypothetical protein HOD20_08080 [archaeon]|jgi:4-amino-4-deoxy-L-arabinose transferase-like glycosyltransferase|nr:hypothetical protein [archaeon]MBT4647076.1 hypothetical protein [archaeon]MBT6820985.1 hypothetical protein [archaeon]MBT7392692.1 hypothetical protein [archaeon]